MKEIIKDHAEDDFDLSEFIITIIKYKGFIGIMTGCITLLSIVYVLLKTPIYEVKGLIEIGDYKIDKGNSLSDKIVLDQAPMVEKKITSMFIDTAKNRQDKDFEITSFSAIKGQVQLLEVKAEAKSNELATKGINQIISFIQNDHQKILDDVLNQKKFELENINLSISDIKEKQIKLIDQKINLYNKTLSDLEKSLQTLNQNLRNIESLNPSLAALKLMEKRDTSDNIVKLSSNLYDLEKQKNTLLTTAVYQLEEKKKILESVLSVNNYKNTQIVGDIIKNDRPIKPKKFLIVLYTFFSSFILSVFVAFLLELLKNKKESFRLKDKNFN